MKNLTTKDWDLIKDSLSNYNTLRADELLDKINDLNLGDKFEFEEEFYLNNLAWEYVQLFPSPGMTKELDLDFFKDQNLLVTRKVTYCEGDEYYGKLENHNVYIHLIDNPGSSGYDCCGYIRLTYSDDHKLIKNEFENI